MVHSGDNIEEWTAGTQKGTNNQMELLAAIYALEISQARGYTKISITTDSQYVKDGITKWINGWVKNNWKTSKGKPVKNQELWKQLHERTNGIEIKWNWVKAHTGTSSGIYKYNDMVDKLARQTARVFKN